MKEDPRHIRISEFNYPLPDERIAKFPLSVRDQSKLLLYRHGEVSEDRFTSLPEYLPSGSLMIFNNTKVIQARLHFRKETGALIEVFCLEPIQPNDYALNFQQTEHAAWLCMVGNLKKWKEGMLRREMTVKGKSLTLPPCTMSFSNVLRETEMYSVCISCPSISSLFTGLKVPAPTWSVSSSNSTPLLRNASNTRGVKCSPAVGAATEPLILE